MPNPEEQPNNSSLLSCTLKKSGQVLRKVVLYASYMIVALTAIVIMYCGAIAIYQAILPGVTTVWQFIVAIPWYVYMGIIVIAAIPVYSFLWCIARELTEEDWKSSEANTLVFALFALTLALALLALTLALALLAIALAIAIALFAFALAIALAIALDPVDHITIWYYIFRFPGAACHHYRKKNIQEKEMN